MTYFTKQVAQVVRNTQSSSLPCGGYQYNDKPAKMDVSEAQWLNSIIKKYGSIEAYNKQRFPEGK